MSHLKCDDHGRRVVVIGGKALHRSLNPTETTAACGTKKVWSGSRAHDVTGKSFTSIVPPPVPKDVQKSFTKPSVLNKH